MSKLANFAFEHGDRVFLPVNTEDAKIIQGIISGRKDMIGQESEYDVHFLNTDLSQSHVVCGEGALLAAQPKLVKEPEWSATGWNMPSL